MVHGGCEVCAEDEEVHPLGGAEAAAPGAQEDGRAPGRALSVHQGEAERDADLRPGVGLHPGPGDC